MSPENTYEFHTTPNSLTVKINSEKLLVLIDKKRMEDTPESKEFLKDLLKELEMFQART